MDERPGIGIDYDGVIAHTNVFKSRWMWKHLRRRIPPWKADLTTCVPLIGKPDYDRMGLDVYNRRMSLAVRAVPGARKALRDLAARYRIYVVTARRGALVRWCRQWMRKAGLDRYVTRYLTGGVSGGGTAGKAELCEKYRMGALIDDDPRHFLLVKDPSFIGILFKPGCTGKLDVPRGARLFTRWVDLSRFLMDVAPKPNCPRHN
jgi:hypothetical protein